MDDSEYERMRQQSVETKEILVGQKYWVLVSTVNPGATQAVESFASFVVASFLLKTLYPEDLEAGEVDVTFQIPGKGLRPEQKVFWVAISKEIISLDGINEVLGKVPLTTRMTVERCVLLIGANDDDVL